MYCPFINTLIDYSLDRPSDCSVIPFRLRGRNTYGQLGTGDNEDRLDEADEDVVAVDLGESQAVDIAAGESHVCASLADATVKV